MKGTGTQLAAFCGLLTLAMAGCDDTTAAEDADGMMMADDAQLSDSGTAGSDSTADALGNLVEVAEAAGGFSTLIAALEAADLADTVATGGPFTVLAPTDDAFAALPDGALDDLLADTDALSDVLLYHVIDGEALAADVAQASLLGTLQGSDVKVSTEGGVFVNDAEVVMTDILADNGVIHVIDAVLTPPGSIADIVTADPNFSTLLAALDAAGLATTVAGDGPFTVFAPTNAAFDGLPDGVLDGLLADIPALTDVLTYHVVADKVVASDVVAASSLDMLQGSPADITMDGGNVLIDGVVISVTDIPARNGVIHVLDGVMLP